MGVLLAFVVLVHRRSGLRRAAGRDVLRVMAVFSAVVVAPATMLLALGDAPPARITVMVY